MTSSARPAPSAEPIHDLVSHRWSPRAFADRPVEPEKLRSLFEAARWASSSYNAQPWFYIVATKDDPANLQPGPAILRRIQSELGERCAGSCHSASQD